MGNKGLLTLRLMWQTKFIEKWVTLFLFLTTWIGLQKIFFFSIFVKLNQNYFL